MSQANDLLNTLAEENTTDTNGVEQCIVINSDRTIYVPPELKKIAVQYDHNIETVTFDMPRYWDNNDMSAMNVQIIYVRPDGEPGHYSPKSIIAEDNRMKFDWTIDRYVTDIPGALSVQICVKNIDAQGDEHTHWSSEINKDLYVSPALPCGKQSALDTLVISAITATY